MPRYLLLFFLAFNTASNCQPTLTVASGFSINAFKKSGSSANFNAIPISLQWSPLGLKNIFIVKVDYFIPFTSSAYDQANTTNPNLPPVISVQKSIHPSMFDFNVGARIPIHRYRNKYNFYADALFTAFSYQKFRVNYSDYDKDNYEILNSDFSSRKASISFCMGLVYKYILTDKSSLLCMFHLQYPPLASSKIKGYSLSYTLAAPLQFTIGYSFSYKRNKKSK